MPGPHPLLSLLSHMVSIRKPLPDESDLVAHARSWDTAVSALNGAIANSCGTCQARRSSRWRARRAACDLRDNHVRAQSGFRGRGAQRASSSGSSCACSSSSRARFPRCAEQGGDLVADPRWDPLNDRFRSGVAKPASPVLSRVAHAPGNAAGIAGRPQVSVAPGISACFRSHASAAGTR